MNEAIKTLLFDHCKHFVEQRISTLQNAVNAAQNSANVETKSTAGDKHDTARAMMQLAAEQNSKHLNEAQKLKQVLHLIDPSKKNEYGQLGSLVIAENGAFFISVSAGKIELDNQIYFAISPTSPIGLALKDKRAGETFDLNGKSFKIKVVY